MSGLAAVLERIEREREAAVERLGELIAIPSVSTDPAYGGDVRRAAEWLAEQLRELGFEASLRDTPGHPMVVGHADGPAGAPRVLYYGHYDVQPPDPLELWDSPPFELTTVDGPHGPRMVARGIVDDKGQVMTWIEALRAWKAVHGGFPAPVTVLLEGEEETGSPSLPAFLEQHAEELRADVAVVSDTDSWDVRTPAITTMLRGLVYTEITLEGPSRDMHSGMYGGVALNPIGALTRILGDLHDEHGRVAIPGFYDDVVDLEPALRETWAGLGFDERAFLAEIGQDRPIGEPGYSVLERIWARPAADLNGIHGGYTGPGAKTVIPAKASAKLSFRLVADQDPQKVLAGLRAFLDARSPKGARITIQRHAASAAVRVPSESPYLQAAAAALEEVYRRPAVLIGSGGSIPLVGMLQRGLGIDGLLVGFGLKDDRVHAPNEKMERVCFENGMRSHAAILARLAEARGG
jgi:acetylornithine deacetylase/succinyl-diaminopimelate desuccinylase-like protein